MHIADADLTFFYVACALIFVTAVVEITLRQLGGTKILGTRIIGIWNAIGLRMRNRVLWLLIPACLLMLTLLIPRS